MHTLKSDECELDEHGLCEGEADCGACDPSARPCACSCHTGDALEGWFPKDMSQRAKVS